MLEIVHTLLYNADWAAVGTIALTVITTYYAWSTRRILDATARQAAAAEENVRLLLLARSEQLEHYRAPIRNTTHRALGVIEHWSKLDLSAAWCAGALPNARQLDVPDMAALKSTARVAWYPLYEALQNVETQIVHTRIAVDQLARCRDNDTFSIHRREFEHHLEQLRAAWQAVHGVVTAWQ